MKRSRYIKSLVFISFILTSLGAFAQYPLFYQGFEGDQCENWNYNGGIATPGIQRSGSHSGRVGYQSNTLLFSPAAVAGYSGLTLTIYHSVKSGQGPGMDTREGAVIQVSLNGGTFTTIASVAGFGDASWPFSAATGGSSNGSSGCTIYRAPNPLVLSIPDGTITVQVKVVSIRAGSCNAFNNAMANATPNLYDRSDEGFYIDDVRITTSTPLPSIELISAPGTDSQVIHSCVTEPIEEIRYTTGIGVIDVTGLPPGVSYTYAAGIVSISGSPAADGIYHYTVTNICTDSSATGTIIKSTPIPVTQNIDTSGCNSITFNGIIYTNSVILNDTLKDQKGCDSIYNVTNIIITPIIPVTQTINTSGCNKVLFNGVTYTSSTVLNDTLRSHQGCDSFYNVTNIIINHIAPITNTTNLSDCSSITFNGLTYTSSTVLNDTIKSYQGCDSIYNITNIIIQPITPITQTTNLSGCNSVLFNGIVYTSSITLNDTVRSHQGCDSIYNITNIIIQPITPITQTTNLSGCNSVLFNGITYTSSIILNDTIRSYQRCDSIYNITNIIIQPITPTTQTTNLSGCNNVLYNGITYTSSTILNDTVRSHQGCDSVYNITNIFVTLVAPITQTTNLSGCNSIIFNGIRYTSSIILNDTTRSYQGCDSVFKTTNILISGITPITENNTLTGCNSISFNGTTYTSSITLLDTLTSYQGCDSIYRTTNIIITRLVPSTQSNSISGCNSIIFNGIIYSSSAILKDTISSYQGCDSVYIITNITVNAITATTQTSNIQGCNTVILNGITYTSSAILKDTLRTVQGCDSIYKLVNITVSPIVATTSDSTISACGSIIYNGIIYTGDKEINDTIKSAGGCDSIYRKINIVIKPDNFTLQLTSSGNNINPGTSVTINTSSVSGYNVFAWEPSDLFSLQSNNTQSIVADTTVNIRVTAQSTEGCIAHATLLLTVNQVADDIYFPSAFNPNSNAGNNTFGPLGRVHLLKNYSLLVYNRWGEVVFSSSDPFQKWNGYYKGSTIPGNFVWQASYTYRGTFKKIRRGNILLIK